MNTQKGFTIIEWLIYFFLICFILTGIFHFVAINQQRLFKLSKKSSAVAQLCGAQDGFARDLSCICVDTVTWTFFGEEEIAWQTEKQKVNWILKKRKLYRSQQEFNQETKAWKKKKRIVVARNIQKVIFLPYYKKFPHEKERRITHIKFKIEHVAAGQACSVERTILLPNRIII